MRGYTVYGDGSRCAYCDGMPATRFLYGFDLLVWACDSVCGNLFVHDLTVGGK